MIDISISELLGNDIAKDVVIFLYLTSVILSIISVIVSLVKNGRIKKVVRKELNAMEQNKENQKKEEEDLKDMAIFLCDRCGKKINVKDAVDWNEYSICRDCSIEISKLEAECEENKIALDKAIKKFQEARREMQEAQAKYAKSEKASKQCICEHPTECVCESHEDDANILNKLGINK